MLLRRTFNMWETRHNMLCIILSIPTFETSFEEAEVCAGRVDACGVLSMTFNVARFPRSRFALEKWAGNQAPSTGHTKSHTTSFPLESVVFPLVNAMIFPYASRHTPRPLQ